MADDTKELTPEQQKELFKHFKAMIAAKRFLDANGMSAYYLKDVIVDTLVHVEKHNLI